MMLDGGLRGTWIIMQYVSTYFIKPMLVLRPYAYAFLDC
jgi:hypothetical protein